MRGGMPKAPSTPVRRSRSYLQNVVPVESLESERYAKLIPCARSVVLVGLIVGQVDKAKVGQLELLARDAHRVPGHPSEAHFGDGIPARLEDEIAALRIQWEVLEVLHRAPALHSDTENGT